MAAGSNVMLLSGTTNAICQLQVSHRPCSSACIIITVLRRLQQPITSCSDLLNLCRLCRLWGGAAPSTPQQMATAAARVLLSLSCNLLVTASSRPQKLLQTPLKQAARLMPGSRMLSCGAQSPIRVAGPAASQHPMAPRKERWSGEARACGVVSLTYVGSKRPDI